MSYSRKAARSAGVCKEHRPPQLKAGQGSTQISTATSSSTEDVGTASQQRRLFEVRPTDAPESASQQAHRLDSGAESDSNRNPVVRRGKGLGTFALGVIDSGIEIYSEAPLFVIESQYDTNQIHAQEHAPSRSANATEAAYGYFKQTFVISKQKRRA